MSLQWCEYQYGVWYQIPSPRPLQDRLIRLPTYQRQPLGEALPYLRSEQAKYQVGVDKTPLGWVLKDTVVRVFILRKTEVQAPPIGRPLHTNLVSRYSGSSYTLDSPLT